MDAFIHSLYMKHYGNKAKKELREVCIRCGSRAILGKKRPWLGLCKKCRKDEFKKSALAVLLFILMMPSAFALTDAEGVQIVMAEARGEGYIGMKAVGEVARRVDSVKPFCGFKVKINEPKWVWDLAEKAWKGSATSNITLGATHFESTDFAVPGWARSMKKTVQIKKHIFYKEN